MSNEAVDPNNLRASEPDPERRRSRRLRLVRTRTINVDRIPKRDLAPELDPDDEPIDRPRTRGDCASVSRPCPFVTCKHHLYLDVRPRTGNITLNFPDLEPDELPPDQSCALDVAERGGCTLQRTGDLMNMTRERVRQIEQKARERILNTITPELHDELAEAARGAGG